MGVAIGSCSWFRWALIFGSVAYCGLVFGIVICLFYFMVSFRMLCCTEFDGIDLFGC